MGPRGPSRCRASSSPWFAVRSSACYLRLRLTLALIFILGCTLGDNLTPKMSSYPPLTHIPIDAELNLLHVGYLKYWAKVNFDEVI